MAEEYVNCYDPHGVCLFSVPVKEGVKAEKLMDHIYFSNDNVDACTIAKSPEGAIIKY